MPKKYRRLMRETREVLDDDLAQRTDARVQELKQAKEKERQRARERRENQYVGGASDWMVCPDCGSGVVRIEIERDYYWGTVKLRCEDCDAWVDLRKGAEDYD